MCALRVSTLRHLCPSIFTVIASVVNWSAHDPFSIPFRYTKKGGKRWGKNKKMSWNNACIRYREREREREREKKDSVQENVMKETHGQFDYHTHHVFKARITYNTTLVYKIL